MKSKDIGHKRVKLICGWEFVGIERSPYVKKRSDAPLTAKFKYFATKNGVEIDTSRFLVPNQRSLTMEELLDGFQANVHCIPETVIGEGRRALERKLSVENRPEQAPSIKPAVAAAPKLVAA